MTLHYDVIIIGSGAGGGTMARALSNSRRPRPRPRARRGGASGSRTTGIPRRSGSISVTARPNGGSMDEGTSFCPTRTTASAATRSSGAARSIVCVAKTFGDGAHGRRLAGLADRLRHARAVLRPRRTALSRARAAATSIPRSHHEGRFHSRRFRTRQAWPRSSTRSGDKACILLTCRSG